MPNVVTIFKNAWTFVSENLWQVRLGKVDKNKGILIKQLRIFTLAIKGFNEDKCLTKATALTFYTLFSIVPILALAFAIAKGFGLEKTLQSQILNSYGEYQGILSKAFVYADSLLQTAKGGIIAGFGVVLLLWSIMNLFISIEDSFNQIWEIKKGRNWVRKITDYLAIMIISPIFLVVSGGLTVAIQTNLGSHEILEGVSSVLLNIVAYFLVAIVFTLLYMILPNTKVQFKSAFIAGVIAMILFQLLEWAYIKFQIGANRLNAIYGGFAALPLFLIWLQYSWYIVLFGAELSFANQNIDHYELENEISKLSPRYKKGIALIICNLVAKRFYNGEKNLSAREIANELDLPIRLARNIINEFTETGIFTEVKPDDSSETTYMPGITESRLTVKNVLQLLEEKGVNSLPITETVELKSVQLLMHKIDSALDNENGNKFIKDIS
jgi:membrane protein